MLAAEPVTPLAAPKGVKKNCELCQGPARLLCTGCRQSYYCCAEHQETEWKAVHVDVCEFNKLLKEGSTGFQNTRQRQQSKKDIRDKKLEVIEVAMKRGHEHVMSGEHWLALPAVRLALNTAIEVHGSASVELVKPYLLLTDACLGLGEHDTAEKYLSQAEWTLTLTDTTDHLALSQLYRGWGKVFSARQLWYDARWAFAEHIFHSSVSYGPSDIHTASGYYYLGSVFLELDQADVTVSMYGRVVTIWNNLTTEDTESASSKPLLRGLTHSEATEAVAVLGKILKFFVGLSTAATTPTALTPQPADEERATAVSSCATSSKRYSATPSIIASSKHSRASSIKTAVGVMDKITEEKLMEKIQETINFLENSKKETSDV